MKFNTTFRGKSVEIDGYVESGDLTVGLFGSGFIYETITFLEDGSHPDYETVTVAEELEIDKEFWKQNRGCGEFHNT